MKKMKNLFWGLLFILIAVMVILDSMGYLGGVSVWTIVLAGFLGIWFITGAFKLSFGSMLFSLAFAAILFDKQLGIEQLTPWPVLIAALCGTIGLNMIFRKTNKSTKIEFNGHPFNGKVVEEVEEDDSHFKCEVAFGASVKYINCQNLKSAKIETAFGNTTIYFDNARLDNGEAIINLENSFGKTTLYIPKEWNVVTKITKAFGSATEQGSCAIESDNRLYINGEVSFGNLEIIYI